MGRVVGTLYSMGQFICPVKVIHFLPLMPISEEDYDRQRMVLSGQMNCYLLYSVPRGKVNILGGHSVGHSKQKGVHVRVSYSELFPCSSYFTVKFCGFGAQIFLPFSPTAPLSEACESV
jgi:hypothetical protein